MSCRSPRQCSGEEYPPTKEPVSAPTVRGSAEVLARRLPWDWTAGRCRADHSCVQRALDPDREVRHACLQVEAEPVLRVAHGAEAFSQDQAHAEGPGTGLEADLERAPTKPGRTEPPLLEEHLPEVPSSPDSAEPDIR